MGTLIMIGQILLALAILVTLHELGHFLAARWFKIRVDKFYLFFDFLFPMPNVLNFALWKKKIGKTEYGIGWFPMGGYVQIAGMVDEQLDKDAIDKPVEPDEFRAKPGWQKLIVLMGGIIFNVILAIIIFIGIKYAYGDKYLPIEAINQSHGIYASTEAEKAGFKTGDRILAFNGNKLLQLGDIYKTDNLYGDKNTVLINRNGKDTTIILAPNYANLVATAQRKMFVSVLHSFDVESVVPGMPAAKADWKKGDRPVSIDGKDASFAETFTDIVHANPGKLLNIAVLRAVDTVVLPTMVDKDGLIGVQLRALENYDSLKVSTRYNLGEAVGKGTVASFDALWSNIRGFGGIFSGKVDASKSLSGPIGIARIFGKEWIWERFWTITAILSMALAFFNILPIPGLDGGHAMFVLYEMATGRPVNEKVQYVFQVIGVVIILSLMVLIFGLDIWKLVTGN